MNRETQFDAKAEAQFELFVLAKREAKKAVKAQLAARGEKPYRVTASRIAQLSREYLAAHHAEIIAKLEREFAWLMVKKYRGRAHKLVLRT